MTQTISIIAYRNPAEQAFWETIMQSEYTFPVFVSVVVTIAAIYWLTSFGDFLRRKFKISWQHETKIQYTMIALGVFVGFLTFKWMVI